MCYKDPCKEYFGDRDEQGRRHGVGKVCWDDGSSYEGEWFQNLRHGNRVFKTVDEEEYRGQLINDMRNSKGKWT